MSYVCLNDSPGQLGGQQYKWAKNTTHNRYRIYWQDSGVKFTSASFGEARQFVKELIEKHCGMEVVLRDDTTGNIQSRFAAIDGPGGVLADQYLPGVDTASTEMRSGRFDSRESPDQKMLNWVTAHEVGGHGLGLSHFSASASLMNPQLNMSIYPNLDDWTIEQLVSRYGPPVAGPPPTEAYVQIKASDWQELMRLVGRIDEGIKR